MLADYRFTKGIAGGDFETVLTLLRGSGNVWPLDHRFRDASALVLGNLAAQVDGKEWKDIAAAELDRAIAFDPNSIEMLAMAISYNQILGHQDRAQRFQPLFDRVARAPMADYLAIQKAILAQKKAARAH